MCFHYALAVMRCTSVSAHSSLCLKYSSFILIHDRFSRRLRNIRALHQLIYSEINLRFNRNFHIVGSHFASIESIHLNQAAQLKLHTSHPIQCLIIAFAQGRNTFIVHISCIVIFVSVLSIPYCNYFSGEQQTGSFRNAVKIFKYD